VNLSKLKPVRKGFKPVKPVRNKSKNKIWWR
jgi:hypothetical protein